MGLRYRRGGGGYRGKVGAYTGEKGECKEQDGEVKDERKRYDNCPLLIGYVLIKSVENGYNTV